MYKFEKIDLDTTRLTYKDKSFDFKRDIELMTKLQSINFKAKRKMRIDLAKEGLTKNDLVKTIQDGNVRYEDNSNVIELEKIYIEEMTSELYDEICRSIFGMNLTELMIDIGISEEKECAKFGEDLTTALTGKNAGDGTSPREYAKTIQ